ncbi:MAG TPA: DinB family protein [Acidobacteriaceae bacterium]|jgi:uncharacterized damage-inducible protein DinB
MSIREEMLAEFREELPATRRILDRVPEDKLSWKPHEKSMSLGQLAVHIAKVPGAIAFITSKDSFDVLSGNFAPPAPKDKAEIRAALEESVNTVEAALQQTSEDAAHASWRLMAGEQEIQARPRYKAWRTLMLNHWYHHRGQLSVYLRLLNVPVPSVYGPSADEAAFG